MTFWCVAHRSDLALDDMESVVPEIAIWLSDINGLSSYFRSSKNARKLLRQVYILHFCNLHSLFVNI